MTDRQRPLLGASAGLHPRGRRLERTPPHRLRRIAVDAWCAAAGTRPASTMMLSMLCGVISWPCEAPAEREMLSSISVPPRSLTPADEAMPHAFRRRA